MSIKVQKDRNNRKEKDVLDDHKIVTQNEWIKARKNLLAKEKEFTILHD